MRNSKRIFKKFFIFLFLLIIFACGEEKPRRNDSEQRPDASNIENQAVNTIEVFGNVKISKYKNISLDFPARIEKIHVMPGQYISQSDSLITLNIDEYYNQIKIKEHELVIEELKLLNLEQEYAQKNHDVHTRYDPCTQSKFQLNHLVHRHRCEFHYLYHHEAHQI